MRRRALGGLVVLWTGLAVGLPAAAGSEEAIRDDAFRPGFYLGLGAVYAFEDFSFTSENLGMTGILGPGVDPGYDDSAGAHVQVGYRLTDWVGAEILYEFLEGFDSTRGTPDTEIDSHLFTLNAKWYAPIEGRLRPYALTGMGAHLVNSEVLDPTVRKPFETDAGFVGRLGGGIAWDVSRHFTFELEGSYQIGIGDLVGNARYGTLALHLLWRR